MCYKSENLLKKLSNKVLYSLPLRACFARTRLRRLSRSLNKIILCVLISNEVMAQPDYGKVVNEGLMKGIMIGLGTEKKAKTNLIQEIMKSEGTGKIETKEGNLKIDTKDKKSLELAENFRKNYKKPKECVEPATDEIRTQCANEYIRARKATIN